METPLKQLEIKSLKTLSFGSDEENNERVKDKENANVQKEISLQKDNRSEKENKKTRFPKASGLICAILTAISLFTRLYKISHPDYPVW